jgi:hypothetical protein
MMDYIANIKKAFRITWENKGLWVLGFLVSLGASSGNSSFNSGSSSGNSTTNTQIVQTYTDAVNWWNSLGAGLQIGLTAGVILIFLLFFLFFLYLSSRAEAGLIKAVDTIDAGSKMGLKEAWGKGKQGVWALYKQRLFIAVPIMVFSGIMLVLFMVFFYNAGLFDMAKLTSGKTTLIDPAPYLVMIPFFCVFVLVIVAWSMVTSVLYVFSSRIAVLKNKGVRESFKLSWILFRTDFKNIALSWLLNFVVMIPVSIVMGIVLVILLMIVVIPSVIIIIALSSVSILAVILVAVLMILIIWVLASIIGSIVQTYTSAYWTLVYKQLKAV